MIISLLSLGIKTETKKLKSYKKTHVRWSKPAVPAIAFYPVHVTWLIFVGFSLKFVSSHFKGRKKGSEILRRCPVMGQRCLGLAWGKTWDAQRGCPWI